MKEIQRVLRPGGVFSLIEHNPLNPVTRLIVSRTPVDGNAKLLTASGHATAHLFGRGPSSADALLPLSAGTYSQVSWFD
jgi:hypothetical protein